MTNRPSRADVGLEPTSGMYYEILGSPSSYPHPILFIHGGGATGRSARVSQTGQPGWADLLAGAGYESWVTDWAGAGRSAYRDFETFEYRDAVDGYRHLVSDIIKRPVVIVPHSMGGAIAWKLIEQVPELVAGVVGVASAYPANIQRKAEVISDDGRRIAAIFPDTGVTFEVDRERPYAYGADYMEKQAGIDGPLIVPGSAEAMRRFPGAMPPRLVLQRIGAIDGMPIVEDTSGFRGKIIRLVAGDHDRAHTKEIELRTVGLLREWGADADLVWLADEGLPGHSHYLMIERGHREVLDRVRAQFDLMR